jgi:hypothetical protein
MIVITLYFINDGYWTRWNDSVFYTSDRTKFNKMFVWWIFMRKVPSISGYVIYVIKHIIYSQVYLIQHYVIKFVSDLRHVGGFLRFPPPIKLTDDSKIKSYCLFPQRFSSVKIQIFLFCNGFRHVFDIAIMQKWSYYI